MIEIRNLVLFNDATSTRSPSQPLDCARSMSAGQVWEKIPNENIRNKPQGGFLSAHAEPPAEPYHMRSLRAPFRELFILCRERKFSTSVRPSCPVRKLGASPFYEARQ